MSAKEVPEWRDGERATVHDLLSHQAAARDCVTSIACPKMSAIVAFGDDLVELKDRVGEAQVRIAAAGAVAMYDVEVPKTFEKNSEDFCASMGRSLEMCTPPSESQREAHLPFFKGHLRNTSTPGELPFGYVEHYTYVQEKNRRGKLEKFYAKDLYVLWRGSLDFMDWACNANANLAPSQDSDVLIHGGMSVRFHAYKADLEEVMLNFLNTTTEYGEEVEPRRIYFAGHSLGAGLAMLTHFQLYAAQEDHHWPSSTKIREFAKDSSKGVFMIGFAGPPVFSVKNGEGALPDSAKQGSVRGVNFTMEYDVVPRIMNVRYCKDALGSCSKGMIDAKVDSPLVKAFARAMMKRPLHLLEDTLDRNAELMKHLQHLHPVVMQYVDKSELTWQWTLLNRGSFDACSEFDWPYKTESPMSTLIALNDHSVFPSQLDKKWRDDTCSVCCQVPEDPTEMWQDCSHCQATFCKKCFEMGHRDPASGVMMAWHTQEERALADKRSIRVAFTMVGIKAARFLNDMRYNTMLIRMGADVFKPSNIWLAADLLRETGKIGQLATQIANAGSTFAQAGAVASKIVGPAECIFVGAMALCETGWLCYKRWSCKELDCGEFWMKLGACWASAIGTIGGMALGAAAGALIGSIFGPIGTVVGGLIGSMVGGAVVGATARYGTEELIKWAAGLDPVQKEKVDWGIICRAMHCLGFNTNTKPSVLTAQQIGRARNTQALIHHPDKTGLMGKESLTEAEKQELSSASKKFVELQNHFDTLSAFVSARDQEDSAWSPQVLNQLDRFYVQLLEKFEIIDARADKEKEDVARGVATSKGGCIDSTESKP